MTPSWGGLVQLVLLVVVALAAVYRSFGDWRAERVLYRVVRINPDSEQRWTTCAAGVLGGQVVNVLKLNIAALVTRR